MFTWDDMFIYVSLFLFHLCKHWWVRGFACDNIHSGCCSDKSGHLWDRRDDGYSMSPSINGVRLLHACLLPSLTQRQVSPATQQLTNISPPQVFTAFSLSSYWQQIHQLKSTCSSEDNTGREKAGFMWPGELFAWIIQPVRVHLLIKENGKGDVLAAAMCCQAKIKMKARSRALCCLLSFPCISTQGSLDPLKA